MKQIIILFLIFVSVVSCSSETSNMVSKYSDKYVILSDVDYKPRSIDIVYSVFCPHCAMFEERIKPNLIIPEDVTYDEVVFAPFGKYGNEGAAVLAVAKVIGVDEYDRVKQKYFYEMFNMKGANLNNKSADNFVIIGLQAANITIDEFSNSIKSKEVQDLLNHWTNVSKPLMSAYGIPAVLVNGKYLILTGSVSSVDEMNDVIAFLLKKGD